jgi:D-alanyl-D-alanine carboxypeptidase/D-alanyl-D-alanine-endopeptidase (penicillin-binding protein 4)
MRNRARTLVAALALLVAGLAPSPLSAQPAPASAPAAPELQAAVRAISGDSSFRDAKIGIAILDVDSGRTLAMDNEHAPLNPASNAKLYTAAAALALLHPEHKFETTLSGSAKNGSVAGPLVLRGTGDPSLTTADLAELVQGLKTYGIRRIDGDVLVDQRFHDDSFTPPAFEQQPSEWAAFRAPVSAVAVNENTVTMLVRPTTAGQPAHVSFDPPGFVDVEGTVSTGDAGADTVILALSPNGKRLKARVGGAVGETAKLVRYTRRVDDPSLLAGYTLLWQLEQAGIKVTGEVKAGSAKSVTTLVRHTSAPLSSLLPALGKASDNFYAEMVFKSLGGETKGRPAKSEAGARTVLDWLAKVGALDQGLVIKNGSGLFDSNRVTAASMVQLLRVAYRDPAVQPEFLAQLAIGGVDGTLHKRFRNERTRRAVRAKTGTLDDAISLSGYVLGPPGKGPIAFAIMFNNVAGKGSGARAAADKLVELIVRRQYGETK